jgi:MOSC domain-containing protein YiiM
VLTGGVQALGKTSSAIQKAALGIPVEVTRLGLVGDEHADLRIHGGVDKAVHCYPWPHYALWREELPGLDLLHRPGAFGENFSVEGLDEHTVCIGDRWRIGSAEFEVSQGRQPCQKLNLRFEVPHMAARVQQTARAGWYFRVIEPGIVRASDALELRARPHPAHSVASLLELIRDRETDAGKLAAVLELPLTSSWRRLFERRVQTGSAEDWTQRIGSLGPAFL